MAKIYNVPNAEQETSINLLRTDEHMTIYTNDTRFKTMLNNRGYVLPEEDAFGGVTIKVPVSSLTIRTNKDPKTKVKKERKQRDPNKPKRVLTDEHKAAMQVGRAKKKAEQNAG